MMSGSSDPLAIAGPSNLNVMSVNANKAGMEGLDTDKINAIVEEASKGSKFYEAKSKNQNRIDSQVEEMTRKLKTLSQDSLNRAVHQADLQMERMTSVQVFSRVIVHVDMDAFYAAVEERDDPTLKDKPMAVGSLGMLSTSNYLARRFGVRAAMPGFIGKKLCPQLTIVPPNFKKYQAVSQVVRDVFREYDPHFCSVSLDEAYLDLTSYLDTQRSFGSVNVSASEVVEELRQKIFQRTSLTASAGIAPNTFLAKVCSDQKKPNGQFELRPDPTEILEFVKSLPIRKVSGIGNVTEQLLKRVLGIETCGDLYEKRGYLLLLFSEISAGFFLRTSLGIGNTRVAEMATRERKSMSTESTFKETSNKDELFGIIDELCSELSNDLLSEDLKGCQLTVKIKTHSFAIKTRVSNLLQPSNDVKILQKTARKILQSLMDASDEKPLRLRLIGVRMSGFKERYDEDEDGKKEKQATLDDFLSGPSKTFLTAFLCPNCDDEVKVVSEDAFNVHLDLCLKKSHNIVSSTTQSENQDSSLVNSKSAKIVDCGNQNLPKMNFKFEQKLNDEIDVESEKPKNSVSNLEINVDQNREGQFADLENLKFNRTAEKANSCSNFFGRPSNKSSNDETSNDLKITKTGQNITKFQNEDKIIRPDSNFFGQSSNKISISTQSIRDAEIFDEVACPVCGKGIPSCDTNSHIDECLNREAIKNLRDDDSKQDHIRKRKSDDDSSKMKHSKKVKGQKDKTKSILNYFKGK